MPTPVPGQHIFREKGASNGKQPPPRETPICPRDGGPPGLLPCLAGSTLSTALLRNTSSKSLKTPFSGFEPSEMDKNHQKWPKIGIFSLSSSERKFKPENAAKIKLIAAKLTQNSAEAPSSVELAVKLPLNNAKAPKTGARRFIFQKKSKKLSQLKKVPKGNGPEMAPRVFPENTPNGALRGSPDAFSA